ncbi:hypothetical protein HZS_1495, partial [Henneguya salminicola]
MIHPYKSESSLHKNLSNEKNRKNLFLEIANVGKISSTQPRKELIKSADERLFPSLEILKKISPILSTSDENLSTVSYPPPPPIPSQFPPIKAINPISNLKNNCAPNRTPKVKLKSLQWKPLRHREINSDNQNIWKKCQKLNVVEINPDAIENIFEMPVRETMLTAKSLTDLRKITTGIDHKKLFSMNIVLKKIKKTPEEICMMIRRLEIVSLTLDGLKQIENSLPSVNDEEKLEGITDYSIYINPAERFLILLMKIPDYRFIIRGLIFREEFSSIYTNISLPAAKIICACEKVIKSTVILIFFKYILFCGNYLNSGTKIGNAYGFELTNLLNSVISTKGRTSGQSLLCFILLNIKINYPQEYLILKSEIQELEEPTKINIVEIKEEMSRLEKNCDTLMDRRNSTADDCLKKCFGDFFN